MNAIHYRSRPSLRWESDWWLLYAFLSAGIGGSIALIAWWG